MGVVYWKPNDFKQTACGINKHHIQRHIQQNALHGSHSLSHRLSESIYTHIQGLQQLILNTAKHEEQQMYIVCFYKFTIFKDACVISYSPVL